MKILPDRYRLEVKEGLAIARNEKAPNLVMLPCTWCGGFKMKKLSIFVLCLPC